MGRDSLVERGKEKETQKVVEATGNELHDLGFMS